MVLLIEQLKEKNFEAEPKKKMPRQPKGDHVRITLDLPKEHYFFLQRKVLERKQEDIATSLSSLVRELIADWMVQEKQKEEKREPLE
jgi:hypothetical protein